MKKSVFGFLLISILFSCKNTKEEKSGKNTVIAKDTIIVASESKNAASEEEFKNEFDILIPQS